MNCERSLRVAMPAIVPFVKWDELTFKEWRRVLRVNLDGLYLMCRAGSDLMRRNNYGRIVNFSSNSIFAGTPNMAHYVASKGGVLTFARALATELGSYKITVNSVCPGLTDTEGVQASPHKEAFGFVEMLQAIKGVGKPADIVPAVAFLASKLIGLAWSKLTGWKGIGEPKDEIIYLVSGVLGAGTALYYWLRTRARQLAEEVASELSKVTWPSRREVTNGTTVVIITTVVATAFFALMDRFWGFVTDKVYGM